MAQAAGPRHQLHRARRRARALRPCGRQADAADQPRRRLRRRRHVHGVRHRVRHPRSAAFGEGPGARRRDGRRHRDPDVDDVGAQADRRLGRGARRERARHRRAVLRHVRDEGRQVRLARFARAAVLRRAHPEARARERGPARADGQERLGHAARRGSPSCSRRRRATSGTRSSPGATRATRRCSRCRRRRTTSTSRRARRSSNATACRSRRPRRASRARRPRCSARRRGPASTPTRRSPTGASTRGEVAKLRETGAIA